MTIDVSELARSTLAEAKGDAIKATDLLERAAQKDLNVSNALLLPLLRNACYDAIRSVCRAERGYVWKSAESDLQHQASTGSARVLSHGRRLMDFLLPQGALKVAEATHADLMRAVEFYRKQAKTELQRAKWLELVSERVGGRRKVKNAIDEDGLRDLFREAIASV